MAAATDRRNLRIFTVGGMQREVLALPGPTVAMSGFKDKLMISAHLGLALPGNQCIGTAVFHVGKLDHQLPHFNSLPLAPSSYLAWQGFTDEGVVSFVLKLQQTISLIFFIYLFFFSLVLWIV